MGRSVLSWVCVCVLSLMLSVGCSETAGTAGTSGDGGAGGDGGAAGMGDGGDGGHGGAAAQEFPCTEQGLRDAIALGGGPHTFDCDGPTTITIRESLVAETDLILRWPTRPYA